MDPENKIKILIIEDELLIAEDMKLQLQDLGYEVTGIATEYTEVLNMIHRKIPDIALVDIVIDGDKDGIEVALELKKLLSIPVIFITSHADKQTVGRAKKIKPDGYLVKPFDSKDLYTAIEIAFFNHVENTEVKTIKKDDDKPFVLKDSIFIKKDYLLIKIRLSELKFIKSEGNYVEIYCKGKKFLTRSTMKDFLSKLPNEIFVQVHKSYAVNIEYIDAFEYNSLLIGDVKIPLSRSLISDLKKRLKIEL